MAGSPPASAGGEHTKGAIMSSKDIRRIVERAGWSFVRGKKHIIVKTKDGNTYSLPRSPSCKYHGKRNMIRSIERREGRKLTKQEIKALDEIYG